MSPEIFTAFSLIGLFSPPQLTFRLVIASNAQVQLIQLTMAQFSSWSESEQTQRQSPETEVKQSTVLVNIINYTVVFLLCYVRISAVVSLKQEASTPCFALPKQMQQS